MCANGTTAQRACNDDGAYLCYCRCRGARRQRPAITPRLTAATTPSGELLRSPRRAQQLPAQRRRRAARNLSGYYTRDSDMARVAPTPAISRTGTARSACRHRGMTLTAEGGVRLHHWQHTGQHPAAVGYRGERGAGARLWQRRGDQSLGQGGGDGRQRYYRQQGQHRSRQAGDNAEGHQIGGAGDAD
ncbi:hypothetical protein M8494_27350 [Serratia ureilytica]